MMENAQHILQIIASGDNAMRIISMAQLSIYTHQFQNHVHTSNIYLSNHITAETYQNYARIMPTIIFADT